MIYIYVIYTYIYMHILYASESPHYTLSENDK